MTIPNDPRRRPAVVSPFATLLSGMAQQGKNPKAAPDKKPRRPGKAPLHLRSPSNEGHASHGPATPFGHLRPTGAAVADEEGTPQRTEPSFADQVQAAHRAAHARSQPAAGGFAARVAAALKKAGRG